MRMKRGVRTSLVVLAVAAVGGGVGGCGGGDEDTTASTVSVPAEAQTTPANQDAQPKDSSKSDEVSPKQGKGSSQGKDSKAADGQGGGDLVATPPISSAPQEGSKKAAPGVTTVKEGDNSVQTYGTESSSSARTEAATTVQTYLNARQAGDWEVACSHLGGNIQAMVDRLVAQAQKAGSDLNGCAGVMQALTDKTPPAALRQGATIDEVLSFRVDGAQGFLLFVGPPGETLFSVPMRLEAGEWKLGTIAPITLPV